jgi:translation initiation factor 2 beta subunit (eIF-2beta)/eIF-5
MTPEEKKIKEEIAFYDSLFGKAKETGENIDELIELSQRIHQSLSRI